MTLAKASVPLVAAALYTATGSYTAAFTTVAVCCAIAAAAIAAASTKPPHPLP